MPYLFARLLAFIGLRVQFFYDVPRKYMAPPVVHVPYIILRGVWSIARLHYSADTFARHWRRFTHGYGFRLFGIDWTVRDSDVEA